MFPNETTEIIVEDEWRQVLYDCNYRPTAKQLQLKPNVFQL